MPIREYRCNRCGNVFENIEIEVTTGNVVCPNCKSRDVQQMFSIFSRSASGEASCNTNSRFT